MPVLSWHNWTAAMIPSPHVDISRVIRESKSRRGTFVIEISDDHAKCHPHASEDKLGRGSFLSIRRYRRQRTVHATKNVRTAQRKACDVRSETTLHEYDASSLSLNRVYCYSMHVNIQHIFLGKALARSRGDPSALLN